VDIDGNVRSFRGDGGPERRFASFDYCFNYFQRFCEQGRTADIASAENMQVSCLQLGFYLASWGMFRGSTGLRSRSARQFQPVVKLIAAMPADIWSADAHCYSEGTCIKLVGTASQIAEALHYPDGLWPTSTLATKIMLGVFGNVPAFDSRVTAGLRKHRTTEHLVGRFGARALMAVGDFYARHREEIERNRGYTIGFETSQPTQRRYTQAKVIDEIFYMEGSLR
jgi:hypothetical protein